jgi:hypothetical protein
MPSFGLLKEQVLTHLQEKYTDDKKLFQEGLTKFVKTLKKSKVLTELFTEYDKLLKAHYDDEYFAKEYLEETVNYLRTLKLTAQDLALLESLERSNLTIDKMDPYVRALDTLVFANRKNIKERLEAKQLLTKKMVTENLITAHIDPRFKGVFFEILQKKVKNRLSQLNEQELLAIEAFAGHDAEQILANYIRLIDDNVSAIEEQVTKIPATDPTYPKLQQVKDTLIEMKKESQPSLGNLERLLVLKEGFNR